MNIKETFKKNIRLDCSVAGAFIGLLAFLLIYGVQPLNVTDDRWILTGYVEGDIIQHYAGWINFRNADWAWPLGYMDTVAYPEGAYISFTDSIPIFALFFKLIKGVLPAVFQYFGLYILSCFILQGISAALLLTEFTENRFAIKLASVFFVISPVMIERAFRHTALASHFLVLFALYFYFHSRHNKYKLEWGFAVLFLLAVLIHPYFLPMVFGIFCANLLELFINKVNFTKVIGFAVFSFVPCIAAAYAIGVIGTGINGSGGNYGLFSMNLNAMVNPISCDNIVWSSVLNVLPQIRGNYDGFNYLGLGILLGLVVIPIGVVLKKIRADFTFFKRNIGILIASIVFFAFAVSNVVTYNDKELFFVELPEKIYQLCSIFRASGRMFYPDFYLIILAVVLGVLKITHNNKAVIVLGLLVGVQIFDLWPALETKHQSFQEETIAANYDQIVGDAEENWNLLSEGYSKIKYVQIDSNYFMASLSGKSGIKDVNVFISARENYDSSVSDEAYQEVLTGQLQEDVLYIMSDINTASLLAQNIDSAYAVYQIRDNFVIAKRKDALADIEFIPDGKVTLWDMSDEYWQNGISIYAPTWMMFKYNPLVEEALYQSKYIKTENHIYEIQSVTVIDYYIEVIVDQVEDPLDLAYPVRLQLTSEKSKSY